VIYNEHIQSQMELVQNVILHVQHVTTHQIMHVLNAVMV
jgi:hypothetical protein